MRCMQDFFPEMGCEENSKLHFKITFKFNYYISRKQKRPCKFKGNCIIDKQSTTLRACGFCRFQKCLSVGMKPAKVQHNIRKLSKEYQQKRYYERFKVYDSSFPKSFPRNQKKSPKIFQRKETSDHEPQSSDREIPVDLWKCNELVPVWYSSPLASRIICPRKPILWVKELWSTPIAEELLKFRVIDAFFEACGSFKSTIICLNPSSDADQQFFQSLMIPSFDKNPTVTSDYDSTRLYLQTTNGLLTFDREASSIFNIHVSIISKNESSIVIMESLNDDHWTRLKDIISFASILHQYTSVCHKITTNCYPLDQMIENLNQPGYTCTLYTSLDRGCNIVSKAIESLSFFCNLSIEDQLIILKESFLPIGCLIFNYRYDDETESYVVTALNGKFSYCYNKDGLKMHSSNQYSGKLDHFYKFFLEKFLVFLRTDFFLISILSILCVLQENTGLSCRDLLETERKYYCEILDAYIRAKVISNEWTSDIDVIWRNIHEIFFELSKYPTIFKQFVEEQNRIKID